jgi:peroxiredoxin/N-acetylglutamate synthase-like GNAT family acetyltransferase
MFAGNPNLLPPDLPVPLDDDGAAHLWGAAMPGVLLASTAGGTLALRNISGPVVFFFYPRTGVPGQPPNLGYSGEDWDTIPGARGCTPQSCGFRDLYAEFRAAGVQVYGVSTNTTEHQREFVQRSRIPFEMLSDSKLELVRAMQLPTFEFPVESGGPSTLNKRMAWYVEPDAAGVPRIAHVWYPVFPPDRNADAVLGWLKARRPCQPAEPVRIRATTVADLPWVREELTRHWLGTAISSRDVSFQADTLPALVAETRGHMVGLLTHQPASDEWEVITLSAAGEGRGTGAALLAHAADLARAAGAERIFLTTSNDNLNALGFYQKRGWRLVAIHRGAMDRARVAKPGIPAVGMNGIPMHDEIELELRLRP